MRLLLWHVPFFMTLYVFFIKFLITPEWEILLQYLQVCGLLQPLDWGLEGCGISALTNISFHEVGL